MLSKTADLIWLHVTTIQHGKSPIRRRCHHVQRFEQCIKHQQQPCTKQVYRLDGSAQTTQHSTNNKLIMAAVYLLLEGAGHLQEQLLLANGIRAKQEQCALLIESLCSHRIQDNA